MYIIGKIVNTHGIKGEVKIINSSDFDRFSIGKKVFYELNKKVNEVKIKEIREHKGCLLVKFEGYDNINDVLFLKGLELYGKEKNKIEDDSSFYYEDIIGKIAITNKNEIIGKVISLFEVPQGHILEILKKDGKKALVPFRKEFVGDINDEHIIIFPIEGLL